MDSFTSPTGNIDRLNLNPDWTVADLGAGTGHYTFDIAKRIKAEGGRGVVYAVDVQRALLEKVKREAERLGLGAVHILWSDIEVARGIKLADNICDAVIVSNVLFQAPDKKAFLTEASRIMKPGGIMMIIDWSLHIRREDVVEMAILAGLVIKEEFNAGSHHFGLLARKR
ncbi:MAG TPA: methyltransferase domain-containing protein [Candidatus Paceibacterota bacterium]